jgi:phosphotransferase system  glucose/maltose/N-acetylglucosamine-specific IIC component
MTFYKIFKKHPILIIFVLLLCLVSGPITSFLMSKDFNLITTTSNDWIGFLGSIWGGIIGGLFTLFGVLIAFSLSKDEKDMAELPQKISYLSFFENTIRDQMFSNYVDKEKFNQSIKDLGQLKRILSTNLEKFKQEINKVLNLEEELTSKSATVNTKVFANLQNYFKSVHLIKKYVDKNLCGPISTSSDVTNIYKEILLCIQYHYDITNITIDNLKNERKIFLQIMHGQENVKQIETQFSHEFLKKIKENE